MPSAFAICTLVSPSAAKQCALPTGSARPCAPAPGVDRPQSISKRHSRRLAIAVSPTTLERWSMHLCIVPLRCWYACSGPHRRFENGPVSLFEFAPRPMSLTVHIFTRPNAPVAKRLCPRTVFLAVFILATLVAGPVSQILPQTTLQLSMFVSLLHPAYLPSVVNASRAESPTLPAPALSALPRLK